MAQPSTRPPCTINSELFAVHDQRQAIDQSTVRYPPEEFSVPLPNRAAAQIKELRDWHEYFELSLGDGRAGLISDHPQELKWSTGEYFKRSRRKNFRGEGL